jgi:hypothetical protein
MRVSPEGSSTPTRRQTQPASIAPEPSVPIATQLSPESQRDALNLTTVIPNRLHSSTPVAVTVAIPISSELENQITIAPLENSVSTVSANQIDRSETPPLRYHLEYNRQVRTRHELSSCMNDINHSIQNHCEHPLAPCIVKTVSCTTAATTTACLLGSQCIGGGVLIASFFIFTGVNLMTDITRLEQ